MISPNQIKMQTFTSAGRGAYRAADVDAFMQELYVSYTELLSENASMKKKFASLSSIIDEYNAGKNAIATALVKAQAVADETLRTAKVDATTIVADAKEEANNILNESQQQAETYAREKKEAADAYFDRAEKELQRVMGEAKIQSDAFVKEVNEQASALIADANQKAAAIVGAAYKDAKVAKEKTEEIITRAEVEIETTRNEVLSFKESALQMLSRLLPLVEGIDPDTFTAPDLTASTEIPQLEANSKTAPLFELKDGLAEDAAEPAAEEPAPAAEEEAADEPEPEAEEAEPDQADAFDFSKHDELIARMESILHEEKPDFKQESLFDEPAAPSMPVYHPYEPAAAPEPSEEPVYETDDRAPAFEVTDTPAAPDFEEIDVDDEDESEAVAVPVEEAPAFDVEDVEDDDDEDDDVPREPFKFRLTKNFDIFDDDDN